jgi:hypothetical protein
MSGSNLPITSREYKLMLNVDRFKDRADGSQTFLNLIDFLIKKEGGSITEKQDKEEKRQTSYLDTVDLALNQRGFALRLREEAKTPAEFQINFKFRASDRYLSAAQDVSSPSSSANTKFEEDILPPFVSKFSHSTTIKSGQPPDLSSENRVASLFPAVESLGLKGNPTIKTIKDFTATEVVRKLCKFQFGDATTLKASLSFWYLTKEMVAWPLVAEFSFDYDLDLGTVPAAALEKFPAPVVDGANRLFGALQAQTGWMSPNGTTKTAFALDAL